MTVRVMTGTAQTGELPPKTGIIRDKPVVFIPPKPAETRTDAHFRVKAAENRCGYGRVLVVRFVIAVVLFAAVYSGKQWGSGMFAEICGQIAGLFG